MSAGKSGIVRLSCFRRRLAWRARPLNGEFFAVCAMLWAVLGCLGGVLFVVIYCKRPATRLVAKRGRPALRRVAVFADIVLLFHGAAAFSVEVVL